MSDPQTQTEHSEWLTRFARRHRIPTANVQEMTFDDEEAEPVQVAVHRGDPGIPGEQQIVNLLQPMRDGIQDYWSNYANGLQNFVEAMQFESEASAQPNYLQATLKAAADEALGAALGAIPSALGPIGDMVGAVRSVSSAWVDERERAQAAAGQVRIRDYVASIRNGISGHRTRMYDAVSASQRPLIQHFQRQATRDVGQGTAGARGAIVGESARVLNEVQRGVQAFRNAIPTAQRFQQRFTSSFASQERHAAGTGRLTGNLYTQLAVVVERGEPDRWSVRRRANRWTLITNQPNPDRVAESLQNSLENRDVWSVDLPKMVRLSVEIRGDDSQASPTGFIRFERDPARFTVRTNGSPDFLREAWQQDVVRRAALAIRGVEGSSS